MTAIDAPADFQQRNVVLFTTRMRIQQDLAFATYGVDGDSFTARQVGVLTRRLDTITSDIVEANRGLVKSYVRLFTSNTSAHDSEDFEGAGLVGLMRAIDTYDPAKGKFGSWAFKPIQREVLGAVRNSDHQNISSGDFERRPDIIKAVARLQDGDDDYTPTLEEVAAEAGVTVEQVRRVLQAPHLESLSTPIASDGEMTVGDMIVDRAPAVDDLVLSRMDVAALARFGLACLDEQELFVLSRRFGLDCEPEQRLASIGEVLDLSREAVRQIELKALSKMRHPVTLRKILSQRNSESHQELAVAA
jgi:DNA-directed RNA polymerase specialized sigma subunit